MQDTAARIHTSFSITYMFNYYYILPPEVNALRFEQIPPEIASLDQTLRRSGSDCGQCPDSEFRIAIAASTRQPSAGREYVIQLRIR